MSSMPALWSYDAHEDALVFTDPKDEGLSRTSGAALYFPALHRMGWRIAGLKALPSARRGTVKF